MCNKIGWRLFVGHGGIIYDITFPSTYFAPTEVVCVIHPLHIHDLCTFLFSAWFVMRLFWFPASSSLIQTQHTQTLTQNPRLESPVNITHSFDFMRWTRLFRIISAHVHKLNAYFDLYSDWTDNTRSIHHPLACQPAPVFNETEFDLNCLHVIIHLCARMKFKRVILNQCYASCCRYLIQLSKLFEIVAFLAGRYRNNDILCS